MKGEIILRTSAGYLSSFERRRVTAILLLILSFLRLTFPEFGRPETSESGR